VEIDNRDFAQQGRDNNNNTLPIQPRIMSLVVNAAGIVGAVIGAVSLVASIVLYGTGGTGPFALGRQALSDLAWGPAGSGIVLRIGTTAAAFLITPYLFSVSAALVSHRWKEREGDFDRRCIRKGTSIMGAVCVFASLFGAIVFIVAPDPRGGGFFAHTFGAGLHAFSAAWAAVAYTIGMAETPACGTSAPQVVSCITTSIAVIGMSTGLLHAIGTVGVTVLVTTAIDGDTSGEIGTIVLSGAWWFPAAEVLYAVSAYVWIISTSLLTLEADRTQRRSVENF
jgi:hypothetical protein